MHNTGEYGRIAIVTEASAVGAISNELFKCTCARMESLHQQGYRTIVLMSESEQVNSMVSMAATRLTKSGQRFCIIFMHNGILSLPISKQELSTGQVVSLF